MSHDKAGERKWRLKMLDAFNRWCSSTDGSRGFMDGPRAPFEAGFEAGRLEAELDHLGLEPLTVSSLDIFQSEVPAPRDGNVVAEAWVKHRGIMYVKRRDRA